jgi:vitellogenic carboxypeptidase-like protein
MLYVDNPVGTGFSFTDDPDDFPSFVEETTEDLYNLLQQFFQLFPELVDNPFFAMGESYGGKYVPSLGFKIHQENKKEDQPANWTRINLAGIGMGNGWMSPLDQGKYASYLFFHGLLDKAQYQQLDEIDGKILSTIAQQKWLEAWQGSDQQLNFILTALNYSNLYDISKDQYRPSTMNFWHWLTKPTTRRALHVGNLKFSDGLQVYMSMIEDTMRSVKPYLEELLPHYPVLAYHGALDIICHYPGAEQLFSMASWPGHAQFMESHRSGLWVRNQDTGRKELAGFVKKGGNLRLVLVRNAGHSVPINQPQWALRLLEEFVGGRL